MMGPRRALLALLALAAHAGALRSLQQRDPGASGAGGGGSNPTGGAGSGTGGGAGLSPVFATLLYSPTPSGGLTLVSNYTLLANARGTSLTTAPVPPGVSGRRLSLTRGAIEISSFFTNARCVVGQLNSSGVGMTAFLTTSADYQAMYNGEIYNLYGGVVAGGLNLSRSNPGPVTAVTDPIEVYTLFIYSLDRRPELATYQLSAYPTGAPECGGAAATPSQPLLEGAYFAGGPSSGRSGAATAPSPYPGLFTWGKRLLATPGQFAIAPAAAGGSAGLQQTAQIRKIVPLQRSEVYGMVAITNASCIAYRSRGQPPALVRAGTIDLTVLIVDRANLLLWGNQAFAPTARGIATAAECLQNNAAAGPCGGYLDNLNASETYFILAANGLQNPRSFASQSLVELYYTAQSEGSCANNAVQLDRNEPYYGQGGTYSYDDYSSYYDDYGSYYDDYGDSGSGPPSPPASPLGRSAPPPPVRSSGGGGSLDLPGAGTRSNRTAQSPTLATNIFPTPTLPVG